MKKQTDVVIEAPKFESAVLKIIGVSPYVQNKFGASARKAMRDKQAAGSQANKNRKRDPKDFDKLYKEAMHTSTAGWHGIPAPAFRNAMISACRIVGFKMTIAKLSLFVHADGFDADDGMPLVKIAGKPRMHEGLVKNETGVADIRCRPMWEEWSCNLRVRWDASQFSAQDVVNLLARVGSQVGIGAGRPDSENSPGVGWGLFEVRS